MWSKISATVCLTFAYYAQQLNCMHLVRIEKRFSIKTSQGALFCSLMDSLQITEAFMPLEPFDNATTPQAAHVSRWQYSRIYRIHLWTETRPFFYDGLSRFLLKKFSRGFFISFCIATRNNRIRRKRSAFQSSLLESSVISYLHFYV